MRRARARTARPWRTKPGAHGTLYRYRIDYRDPCDPAFPPSFVCVWAYDAEHALERFYDGPDDGFEPVGTPTRLRERR